MLNIINRKVNFAITQREANLLDYAIREAARVCRPEIRSHCSAMLTRLQDINKTGKRFR